MKSLDILDCRANLISEFPPFNGPINIKVVFNFLFSCLLINLFVRKFYATKCIF